MTKYGVVAATIALILLGISMLVPWVHLPFILALTYGFAALGVVVLLRAGQISFGHAMYLLISGYTVAFLNQRFPNLDGSLLIIAGTLTSLLCGMVIGGFVIRYRSIFFGMLNLALSMVLFTLVTKLYSLTGGSDGLRINRPNMLGHALERSDYELVLLAIVLVFAVIAIYALQKYFQSAAGVGMRALKSNEDRLEYLGISAKKLLWQGYVLSAGLCGFSGAIYALAQGLITPEAGYWLQSSQLVFIAILGGSTHAAGVFAAAFLYEFVKLYAAIYVSGYWQLILGTTLILIIYFLPNGLVSLFKIRPSTSVPKT